MDTVDIATGTVNASAVYSREVIEGALKSKAVSIICVHNHPAGNPDPSGSDMMLTRELVYASKVMQITLLDHIIIGDNAFYSFAGAGLMEEYEADYLNMKLAGTAETRRRLDGVKKKTGRRR